MVVLKGKGEKVVDLMVVDLWETDVVVVIMEVDLLVDL